MIHKDGVEMVVVVESDRPMRNTGTKHYNLLDKMVHYWYYATNLCCLKRVQLCSRMAR